MKLSQIKAVSLIVVAVVLFSALPIGRTQEETGDSVSSFLLLNHVDGHQTYELNISIPYNLYQYYKMQSHFVFSPDSFSQFVTPYALKPVADRLWQIYNNTEDYTNGVLMLVHQITYKEVLPGRYPVETLVNGYVDCDLFAYIAVSILEAGGIPAVLVYYQEKQHMEIAVNLGSLPTENRTSAYSVTVGGSTYYIGECTGGDWRHGWRVGECPKDYQNATSQVVTLKNMEQSSVGQVSAELRELDPSTLTLQVSSSFMLADSQLVISGKILPQTSNENVTIQARTNNGSWVTIATVETQQDGSFNYTWQPSADGSVEVQASWEGNSKLNGATSAISSVFVLPLLFILLVLVAVLLVVVLLLVFVVMTRHRRGPSEPNSIVL